MTLSTTAPGELPGRIGDAGAALLAALAFLALQAVTGFTTLFATTDNDSMLRLVEVRDLIGGQGWFDLTQYRMGPPGGFVMHWSRLVDAPIAAIVLAASAVTGSMATGETVALVLWPAILFAAALYFLLRTVRSFAGGDAMLPALLIGATSLYYIGVFAPGMLDHHNVQIVLALAMVSLLIDASARNSAAFGVAAGVCAALQLGAAMEAVPYVAAAGLVVALWFLFKPAETFRVALGFGLALGVVAGAAFVATIPPDTWFAAQCDAFSLPQLVGAALSGFGLAAIAASAGLRTRAFRRAAALGVLGLALTAMLAGLFPQCLADPYAGLDPRLQSWWLDAITEAQPLWKIVSVSPQMAAGHYATPLVALLCLAVAIWRNGLRRDTALIAAVLGAAFLVSLWQVRGSVFSIPFAVIPLAAFVTEWRRRATGTPSTAANVGMACAWIVSFNVTWSAAAGVLTDALAPARYASASAMADTSGACLTPGDFDQLAAMPATGVLAVSNLGAPVLRYTPHRTPAGPYHRNIDGNRATLDAFTGPIGEAAAIVRGNGMGLVAVCRGNGESRFLAVRAPEGLMAALLSGKAPDWLEILPESWEKPLELYRVLPPA